MKWETAAPALLNESLFLPPTTPPDSRVDKASEGGCDLTRGPDPHQTRDRVHDEEIMHDLPLPILVTLAHEGERPNGDV